MLEIVPAEEDASENQHRPEMDRHCRRHTVDLGLAAGIC